MHWSWLQRPRLPWAHLGPFQSFTQGSQLRATLDPFLPPPAPPERTVSPDSLFNQPPTLPPHFLNSGALISEASVGGKLMSAMVTSQKRHLKSQEFKNY